MVVSKSKMIYQKHVYIEHLATQMGLLCYGLINSENNKKSSEQKHQKTICIRETYFVRAKNGVSIPRGPNHIRRVGVDRWDLK